MFGLDYDMQKNLLRIGTILAGLFCIWPVELSPIANFQVLGILFPRMLFGAIAILFAWGSFRKMW